MFRTFVCIVGGEMFCIHFLVLVKKYLASTFVTVYSYAFVPSTVVIAFYCFGCIDQNNKHISYNYSLEQHVLYVLYVTSPIFDPSWLNDIFNKNSLTMSLGILTIGIFTRKGSRLANFIISLSRKHLVCFLPYLF